ncbi:hypothetical protein K443DRAFT_330346 [Laccaria amethystina LaAM-08-1]|uniref:Uncharacterized protein n=1 Tax=Laccaria amethystina LaAM-08-1 TaxID=1095629 RepID=A0A0C9XGR2_9AGAR|nr:hypothetical protein K443DRAFT_330346 [Laccaria amethystina LaAM-08-1]
MRLFAFTSSAMPVIAIQILVLLLSDHAFGAVISIERRMWSAKDLKNSAYRKEAKKYNNGAYLPNASNTKVVWKKGGNGDAEHIIEPGAHIKPVLIELGIQKNTDFHKEVKKVLNDKNNLSMLDPAANKAKAKLAANPKGDPKRKAIAMHYLQQSSIKQKASKTMAELGRAAKKHKIKNFEAKVKDNVKGIFPHIKRSGLDEYYLD